MKPTFWTHKKDPYELFQLLLENPRIPKTHIAKHFKVNARTGELWFNNAVRYRIIILPFFRRKSFLNFREHFYFIRTRDPHALYEDLKETDAVRDVMYFSVHTGFVNFQVVSKKPLSLDHDCVYYGERSDYYVSIPPNISFEESAKRIRKKMLNLEALEPFESPLTYHENIFENWTDVDEIIYDEISDNIRKSFSSIIKNTDAYSDRILWWYRNRNEFGNTIITYFPEGESSYQSSLFAIDTENDWLLINLFLELPSSSIFYRLDNKLMMAIYLPFTFEARFTVRKVLSTLRKEELVEDYTNSIIEYYCRP